jgi:hypothetical protein
MSVNKLNCPAIGIAYLNCVMLCFITSVIRSVRYSATLFRVIPVEGSHCPVSLYIVLQAY